MVEGIPLASAVTGRVLLDVAAYLTWGIAGECDDVTGAWHAGCVLGAGQAMAFLLSLEGDLASRFAPPRASLFRARPASSCTRCQIFPAPGPLNLAVGWSFPRVRSTMPVSSRGPRRRRSWWYHTLLVNPQHPNPCEAGGVQMRPCRHGLIWDHTVFHVVASCRASPAMAAPSKRNCRIAQRITRTPRRARVRTPARHVPGTSPFGRCVRGTTSAV